jgi:hypothetical protein
MRILDVNPPGTHIAPLQGTGVADIGGDSMKRRTAPMKRSYSVFAACLSLLLLGGLAYDVSAQQSAPPAAAPSAPPTEPTKPGAVTPPSTNAPAPSGQMRQDTPQPPTNTIERSTEKTTVVDHDSSRIFGMQPTVALIIGAVLLVIIVLGLVAMSRGGRDTEVHEHHHRV